MNLKCLGTAILRSFPTDMFFFLNLYSNCVQKQSPNSNAVQIMKVKSTPHLTRRPYDALS